MWGVERPLALGRSLVRVSEQAPATKKPTRPVRKSKKVGRSSDHRVCVRETPSGGVCLCAVLCCAVCLCFTWMDDDEDEMRRDEEKLRHAIFSWDVLGNCAEEGAVSAYGSCLLPSACRSFLLANIPTAY